MRDSPAPLNIPELAPKANVFIGVWGVWGAHAYCKTYWKISPRAPYNYSASIWTSNFYISLGNPKIIFTFRSLGRVHDSRNQLCLILDTPNDSKYFKKIPNHFGKLLSWEITNIEHRTFWFVWKIRAPTNPEDPSGEFSKNLNMGSISFKNMEWEIGNVGSIFSRRT